MRVVILGGGMAGLAAAWALTEPGAAPAVEVTVYQRGWRLGGKGASSRGIHGRIEEHGLHVWLGYYHNAFRLMREVYTELDRPSTAPDCPITSCREAFLPAGRVGVAEPADSQATTWLAAFGEDAREPGTPESAGPLTPAGFVRRAARLLVDLSASLGPTVAPPAPGVYLSASPRPPGTAPDEALLDLGRWGRRAETAALVAATTAVELLGSLTVPGDPLTAMLVEHLDRLRREWTERVRGDVAARRLWQVAGLVLACTRGAVVDGLLWHPAGFAAVDHLDFREWLARHGADPDVVDSPLVRGMYDLVFAYQRGDHRRPSFAAGLGLFLATKLFFEYTGSIFHKMAAGMGEVVFAPLYQALRARGVRFEFFHRLDALGLSADRRQIAEVRLARQARLVGETYDPLVDVGGLPCFPSRPRREQLVGPVAEDAESHWADRAGEVPVTLSAGADFDAVVLATSLGMVPHVCGELLADSARWRDLVEHVPTVATQAAQLWLSATDAELGAPPGGPTVSGLDSSFETYASMTHVLAHEQWPPGERPGTVAYLCATLPEPIAQEPAGAAEAVRRHTIEFLDSRAGDLWPHAVDRDGRFRWELLVGAGQAAGPARLDSQFQTANTDPSDRYVQSVPGSLDYRLRADESGYDNLALAGDWINSGLNAGCIEAAVMAGLQAANAVRGRALAEGVTGSWYGLERVPVTAT